MNIIPGMKLRSRCFRYRYYNATLCMHPANVTSSASYRAWRMITFLATSSLTLWPAFSRSWSAPRHRILTHLAKSAPYFGFISALPRSDFRTRTFRQRAFTNSIQQKIAFLAKLFPERYPMSARLPAFIPDPEIDVTTISVINIVNYYEILKPFEHFYIYFVNDIHIFLFEYIPYDSKIEFQITWFY